MRSARGVSLLLLLLVVVARASSLATGAAAASVGDAATVTTTLRAIASASVTNELAGCETSASNVTVQFLEDGERSFGLFKFSLRDLQDLATPMEGVELRLHTVATDEDAELTGRLEVVLVHNTWDPASLSCNSLPDEVQGSRTRRLSGMPWDKTFSLDVFEFVQLALRTGHTMSIMVRPEENSGEVHIGFGSTSEWHVEQGVAPELVVTRKEAPTITPQLRVPTKFTVFAGDLFSYDIRIPLAELEMTSNGEYRLPPNKLRTSAQQGPGADESVPTSVALELVSESLGYATFVLRFTPTRVGLVRVSAFWDGEHLEGSPSSLTCSPAEVSAAHSFSNFGTSDYFRTHAVPRVGETSCFDLQTRDPYDNPTSANVEVEVLAGADDRVCQHTVSYGALGEATVCFVPADADMVSVTVRVEKAMMPGFPVEVDCVPGKIVANKTVLHQDDPAEVVAGQWSHFRMTTFDEADHVSNVDPLTADVRFTGPGEVQWNITLVGPAEPQTGESEIRFLATTAGFYEMVARVEGAVLGPFNFTVLPAAPRASKAVVLKGSVAEAVAGEESSFSVASYDSFGNPVVGGGLDLAVVIVPATANIEAAGIQHDVADLGDGSYVVRWLAAKSDVYTITLRQPGSLEGTFDTVEGCPFNVTVRPGPMSPGLSSFVAPAPAAVRAGDVTTLELRERDAEGNARGSPDLGLTLTALLSSQDTGEALPVTVKRPEGEGKALVSMSPRVAGAYLLQVRANDTLVEEATIKVLPAAASPFSSVVVNDFDEASGAQVDKEVRFVVRMRDAFGNDLHEGGLQGSIRAQAIHPGIPTLQCAVTDRGDGRYTVSFTPTTVGFYSVFVYLRDAAVGESPFTLRVKPGLPFGPFTYAAGASLHQAVAGELQRIVLRSRDIGKNDVLEGGAAVEAFLERHPDAGSTTARRFDVAVVDNRDGTYSGTYNATKAGDFSMVVRLNGRDILGSPFAVRVEPNQMGTGAVVDARRAAEGPNDAGEGVAVLVQSRDDYGNPRTVGGDTVVVSFKHADSELVHFGAVTDMRNGTYVASANLTATGRYEVSVELHRSHQRVELTNAPHGLSFRVRPGAVSAAHSSLVGRGVSEAVAGEEARVWLTMRDRFYNDEVTGGAVVRATLRPLTTSSSGSAAKHAPASPPPATVVEVEVSDEGNGTYVLAYTAELATDYSLKVEVEEQGGRRVSVQGCPRVVVVSPAIAHGASCALTGNANTVIAGEAIHYVLHTRDEFGNARRTGGDVLVTRLVGAANGTLESEVRDEGNGLYYVKFTPTKADEYGVLAYINGEPVDTSNFTVRVVPAADDPARCTAAWDGLDDVLEAGVEQSLALETFDRFGNPTDGKGTAATPSRWRVALEGSAERSSGEVQGAGELVARFRPTKATPPEGQNQNQNQNQGNATRVRVLLNGKDISGSPHRLHVVGSDATADASRVTHRTRKLAVGATGRLHVHPRDRFGNVATKGTVSVDVTGPSGIALAVHSSDLPSGDGQNVTFVPSVPGVHRVQASAEGGKPLAGSPFDVLVVPGATFPSQCQVFVGGGRDESVVRLGNSTAFVVIARDAYGNLRMEGGDRVGVRNARAAGVADAVVEDLGAGTYLVTVAVPEETGAVGTVQLEVVINGALVGNSTHTLSVVDESEELPSLECVSPGCLGHGDCDHASGLCACDDGWAGVDCAFRSLRCPGDCSGHGDCDWLKGQCYCDAGFKGTACNVTLTAPQLETFVPEAPAVATSFRIKRPSVIPPKCPFDCSGHGTCVSAKPNDTCACEPGYVGQGCQTRTYFSIVQLDDDFVMVYEIGTGRLSLFQQGIAEDKSCSGLNALSTASDGSTVWRPAQRKYVHIGGLEVLEIDPLTQRARLVAFDRDALAQGELRATRDKQLGELGLFRSREVVYLGMNRLLVSTDNTSALYRVYRGAAPEKEGQAAQGGEDGVFLDHLGDHRWGVRGNEAGAGKFFYAGHDLVGRYQANGTVALYRFDRDASSVGEPAAYVVDALAGLEGLEDTLNGGGGGGAVQLYALAGDVWVAFNVKNGVYKTYYCPTDGDGKFTGCGFLNDGDLRTGYRCASGEGQQQQALPCANHSRVACIKAKACGYCLVTDQCMDGTERGPSNGRTCEAPDGGFVWVFSTNEFVHTYASVGNTNTNTNTEGEGEGEGEGGAVDESRVLAFEPATGKYSLWNVERDANSRSCRALQDTAAEGYLQNTVNHNLLFFGSDVLDFNPATGKFRLATCDMARTAETGRMQCDSWAEGSWPLLAHRRLAVAQLGGGKLEHLLLDYDASNGNYRTWQLARRSGFEAGKPLLRDAPFATGSLSELVAADVTVLPGLGGIVLAHQSITSTTAFFEVVGGRLSSLGRPISKGIQSVVVDGKKMLLQAKYASAGGAALLQYGPMGFWKFLECSQSAVSGDVFGPTAPIHCKPVSAGSPNPPLCDAKQTEEDCTAHPACGWCKLTGKCFGGYAAGVCSKHAPECPFEAWRYVGGVEKGGFIGGVAEKEPEPVPKEHSCAHSNSCGTCVADSECGWHAKSKACVLGGPKGPKDTERYPVENLATDWSFYYCTGTDGCSRITSCADCSAVSYCGFCPSTNTCMTGTLTSPLFETCEAGWAFNSNECDAS